MADVNDLGDVGDFEEPPRHPLDIQAELEKLSNATTETIFEEGIFDDYAEKFPEEFAYQMGETIAMVLGDRARRLRAKMIEGYDGGMAELEEMGVE